jgi:GTP-binding protein EngB required for normal cell division
MSTTTVPVPQPAVPLTASLEEFQSDEQRHVLDTVAQLRKCGLDAMLSLPQIVVCGEQSAGKSSVLEALTEIPFPRQDNLCTRFATEITMRRGPVESLTLRILPADSRTPAEHAAMKAFTETIADFADLPKIMDKARAAMGLDPTTTDARPFARDILSLEIEGPTRPQLTVVDLPGLVQANTKGVTTQDRHMVEDITDFYISQSRTICLAVVAATHDYANQPILTKVTEADPEGLRTLGVITKPDRLEVGSGREASFLALAQNEDIFFRLGWHVVKNRKHEERDCNLDERNQSEEEYLMSSIFQQIAHTDRGIKSLRARLSTLLFEHVKGELPNLRADLEIALAETDAQLQKLGSQRGSVVDCRRYLTMLAMTCLDVTAAAVNGHYEGDYFQKGMDVSFNLDSPDSLRRVRAAVQCANHRFAETMRKTGPKYHLARTGPDVVTIKQPWTQGGPILLDAKQTLDWVDRALTRSRGKEPVGNYNPLIIGELFWEQSSRWEALAEDHIDRIATICETFMDTLLEEKCPPDVRTRLSTLKVNEALAVRRQAAIDELAQISRDRKDFPMEYNHYYTDNVQKNRKKRMEGTLTQCIENATSRSRLPGCNSDHTSAEVDVVAAVTLFQRDVNPDMVRHSCDEVLDYMVSIYKVGADADRRPRVALLM